MINFKKDFKKFIKLYKVKYSDCGPSISSYCEERIPKEKCGCWVHQYKRLRGE